MFAFIFKLIYYLITTLFELLTIKYYTIFHLFILFIFDEGNYFSYGLNNWKLYITVIVYLFHLFMFLVLNEIIELNCFGLEKNLKKNIIIRAYINENSDVIDEDKTFSSL